MLVLRLIKTTHIHFRPDKEAKSVVSVEVDKVIESRGTSSSLDFCR